MTTRRKFIKGAVSAAVAASLPASGDGVALYSARHPGWDINLNPMDNDVNPLKYIEQGPRPVFLPLTEDLNTSFYRATDTLKLVAGGIRKLALEEIEIDIPE